MPFDSQTLDLLGRTPEVEIETRSSGGAVHRTIIWIVVDGSDAFVRSYRGPGARWYREVLADPNVVIHAAGRTIPARAIPAADETSIARTSAGLSRKYAGDPATPAMVADAVVGTTLRLDPG